MAGKKKSRRWIGLVAACAALALLLGVYFLLNREKPQEEASGLPAQSAPALDLIPATTIQRIVIEREGETLTLNLMGEDWVLESEPERPIDSTVMAKFAYCLGTLSPKRLIEKVPENLAQYGLARPDLTVEASSSASSEKLSLGAENPVSGDRYILWSDGAVYTVAATELENLEVSLSDLTYKEKMPSVDLADVRQVTVTDDTGAEVLTLEHLEKPKSDDITQSYLWYVTQSGVTRPAKTNPVETLVKQCLSVDLSDCLSFAADEAQKAEYGLATPRYTVAVETGRATVLTLYFGREAGEKLAMRFNDCVGIYGVEADALLEGLTQPVQELWAMDWLHVSSDDLTGLNLVFSGLALEMGKTEDGWQLNGSAMNNSDFTEIYTALSALVPQGWAEREVEEDADNALVVRLTREGQAALVRFREYDVGFYAAQIEGRSDMLFSRRDVDDFCATAREVYLRAVSGEQSGEEDAAEP